MTKPKIAKTKKIIAVELAKTPIVEVVCKRSGISRATFYRWRKDDKGFAEITDEALVDGTKIINDMAESQLISAIRDKNLTAIIFWLKNHHNTYKPKVEVTAKLNEEELTEEQQSVIKRALILASLDDVGDQDDKQVTNSK